MIVWERKLSNPAQKQLWLALEPELPIYYVSQQEVSHHANSPGTLISPGYAAACTIMITNRHMNFLNLTLQPQFIIHSSHIKFNSSGLISRNGEGPEFKFVRRRENHAGEQESQPSYPTGRKSCLLQYLGWRTQMIKLYALNLIPKMREINYKHPLLTARTMEVEDTNSMAIGLHTNINQPQATTAQKQNLENGCSTTMNELTQASRTFSNHYSTPGNKNEDGIQKRRWMVKLTYKKKIELREMGKERPMVPPPITKKIKKRFDLTRQKTQLGISKIVQISRINSLHSKNLNPKQLTFSERVMLYDWLLQSCEGLKLSRTVFHMTISLIEKISFFAKSNAQSVATACLYTQSMMDDRCTRPIQQFQEITQGFVTTTVIQEYQLRILKDQDWKLPRVSIIDGIFQILEKWDQFVLENPKLIIPEKSQKCMFLRGKLHIQNYIQFMAIIDSLRVVSLINSKNCSTVVATLLVVFVGLELGYTALESLPYIKFEDHPPYQIIKLFTKQKLQDISMFPRLVQSSVKKMYRCISSVMGILIATKPTVLSQVESVRSGAVSKLEFLKQFYFQGMIPL